MPLNLPKPPDTYDNTWANQYTATLEREDQTIWSQLQTTLAVANGAMLLASQFGAKGDGVTNDTVAVQAGLDYASLHRGCLWLGSGVFLLGALTIPANTTLYVGDAAVTLIGVITMAANAKIACSPAAMRTDTTDNRGKITQGDAANLARMILMSGDYGVLRDLLIDGNKANNGAAGPNIYVTGNRVDIGTVTSRNSNSHGLHFFSTGTNNLACCAKITLLMSLRNVGSGIKFENTADCFVSMSEMEANGAHGVDCDNSPTTRIEHCDMGGNTLHGFYAHGAAYSAGVSLGSNNQILIGNQFGNNVRNDVRLLGTSGGTYGNTVVGNQFYPSSFRTSNTYSAIYIEDNGAGGNNITGNVIQSHASFTLKYGVEIVETGAGNEGWDIVSSNTFLAAFGTAPFIGTGKTTFNGNSNDLTGDVRIYGINQISIGNNSSGRRLVVYSPTQYDGVEVQGGLGAIAAIYGNDANNDGGTIALVSAGVANTVVASSTTSYFLGYGLNVGSSTLLRDGLVGLKPQTFASLPTPAAGLKGVMASVTDSTTAVWGAVITGGGGNAVQAVCGPTSWTVMGLVL